jgi:hypothetical protein
MQTAVDSIQTYKCEGCQRRARAPAPYGGFRHTACSEACLRRAQRQAKRRDNDPRLTALVETWSRP